MVIVVTFGLPPSTFNEFMLFTAYFMLVKFAVAGVPGGTAIVVGQL